MDYGGLTTKMGLRDWILSIKTRIKKNCGLNQNTQDSMTDDLGNNHKLL